EENEFSSLRDQAQRLRRENSGLSRRLAEAEAQRNAAVAGPPSLPADRGAAEARAAAAEASRREMVALSTLDKLRQLAAEVEAKSRRPSNALSACLRTWEEQLRWLADSRLAADTSPLRSVVNIVNSLLIGRRSDAAFARILRRRCLRRPTSTCCGFQLNRRPSQRSPRCRLRGRRLSPSPLNQSIVESGAASSKCCRTLRWPRWRPLANMRPLRA
uniref:Dilute domain-containing protein n=1 Tax=Macrostomum lignano TaxID=282301 RepID=A0A1I8FE43_9PLAT